MIAKLWTCFVEFPGELNQKCGKIGLFWEAMKKEGINGLEIKEKRLKCGRFFQLPRELNKTSGENGLFSESRTK